MTTVGIIHVQPVECTGCGHWQVDAWVRQHEVRVVPPMDWSPRLTVAEAFDVPEDLLGPEPVTEVRPSVGDVVRMVQDAYDEHQRQCEYRPTIVVVEFVEGRATVRDPEPPDLLW